MADFNIFQNGGFSISTEQQQQTSRQAKRVEKALKNIAAPVVDFFTKSAPKEETEITNYDEAIAKIEHRMAIQQRYYNDSDPTSRKKIDIVI